MNDLKFNSQVCTTKEQSQRLLELGLKPETADMILIHNIFSNTYELLPKAFQTDTECYIPAWSLHRLLEIYSTSYDDCYVVYIDKAFDDIIDDIEWSINKGYLNKEYLYEETTGKENI